MGSLTLLARCRLDPDLWFSTDVVLVAEAKRECRRCPVVDQCMRLALQVQPYAGVWAGVQWSDGRPAHGHRKALEDEQPGAASAGANRQEGPR